jgi:hypothetical protein
VLNGNHFPSYDVTMDLVRALATGRAEPKADAQQIAKRWHELWRETQLLKRRASKLSAQERKSASANAQEIVEVAEREAERLRAEAAAERATAARAAEEILAQARKEADEIRRESAETRSALVVDKAAMEVDKISTRIDIWSSLEPVKRELDGQLVPGTIVRIVGSVGVLVRLPRGVGMVPFDELRVPTPRGLAMAVRPKVGDTIFLKVASVDLAAWPVKLSLCQAFEGLTGDASADQFDPTLYGMAASYDAEGNYQYPEGFDPKSGEWLEGYEVQREEWERQYVEAKARFEQHQREIGRLQRVADEAEQQMWPLVLEAVAQRSKVAWVMVSQNVEVLSIGDRALRLGFTSVGLLDNFKGSNREEVLREALREVTGVDWDLDIVLHPASQRGNSQ